MTPLPSNLNDLRCFVSRQQERRDIIRQRDFCNRNARIAKAGLLLPAEQEPAYRQEAARLTASLRHLPLGKRSIRRAAERALAKAEKRATSLRTLAA